MAVFDAIRGEYRLIDLTYNCETYAADRVITIPGLRYYIRALSIREDGWCRVAYADLDTGEEIIREGRIQPGDPGFVLGKYFMDVYGGILHVTSPELVYRFEEIGNHGETDTDDAIVE